jgi:putative transposase
LEWPVHVTNRGNDRRTIFLQPADYAVFIELLQEAGEKFAVDLLGYVVMPNHFHLVLSQREEGAVSAYLQRVCCRSACNFREMTSTRGLGHVYQRRYWSQILSDERHYLAALRYVEANALRARLVGRAEDWQWGSLWERRTRGRSLLAPSPVRLPDEWLGVVNGIQATSELQQFRFPKPVGRPSRRTES